MNRLTLRIALTIVLAATVTARADWPGWRGPSGQGFCEEKFPATWDGKAGTNIKWKVPLENQGNSTPVVWGDKIFLTQANKGGTVRSLICLSRIDGSKLWQNDVSYEQKETNWNQNWYANASPSVDGQHVVVSFASAGMYCYNFDGKELWKRTDLGHWEHEFGSASSPVIYGDTVILWVGPNKKGRNFLLSVEKSTGKTVWEAEEKGGSWGTPLITKVDGQDQLLLGVPKRVKGFDPKTGKELWFCDGLTDLVYTSALFGNGVCVSMSGYNGAALAVKLGGTGDITANRLWHHPKNIQRVGSGMIIGDYVYMIEENTVPHCYELMTGKEVWQVEKRPGGTTWGSMLHSDGKLFIPFRSGETLVLAAKPQYEVLTTNALGAGQQTNSSLVVSHGEIYFRTFSHLWCISEKK